jgi:DNA-binding transcriptional ArsR family regulator
MTPHDSTKKDAMQSVADYESCAARLKALADPDRLQIVNLLLRGDTNVSSLAQELSMPVDKVSHHLGVLRAANLVQTAREGKYVIYSLPVDVAIGNLKANGTRTIDLGCCQLDLVQPTLPTRSARDGKRSTRH